MVIGSPAGISTVPRSSPAGCDAGADAGGAALSPGASLPAGVETAVDGDAAPGVEHADSASSAVSARAPTLAFFIQSPPHDPDPGGPGNCRVEWSPAACGRTRTRTVALGPSIPSF